MRGKTRTITRRRQVRTLRQILRSVASWAAIAAVYGSTGCQAPQQIAVADVDPVRWEGAVGLSIENTDTVTLRDIGFFIRCNDRFTDDTLTVRITTFSPDTLRFEELLPMRLSRVAGPAALACEHLVPYRRRVRFPQMGNYRMTIAPTRRVGGVEAVGIGIVPSE